MSFILAKMKTKEKKPTKADLHLQEVERLTSTIAEWGLQYYDTPLTIIEDGAEFPNLRPSIYVVDVETDESDPRNFVGLALYDWRDRSKGVYYFSSLSKDLRSLLEKSKFIGHNVKADLGWLSLWGVNIQPNQIFGDTMIMAYTCSSTEESYGLKDLVFKECGWSYPTYRNIVGTGAKKCTLDKQSTVLVANYCGMDAFVTAKLYDLLWSKLQTGGGARYYQSVELPTYVGLFQIENAGIRLDVDYIRKLDGEFSNRRDELLTELKASVGADDFNPGSPKQVQEVLFKKVGITETETGVKILKQYDHIPEIQQLLHYREVSKLASTYTGAFLALPTLPYVHTTFNQVSISDTGDSKGIRTGRLSSSDPNLQNIPTRTEKGNLIRSAFVAASGHKFIVADYSQIEYRVLAHYSGEQRLIKAFLLGADVHEETGKALGVDRKVGKTLNFAAIYGSQPAKIADTAGISEEQATVFLKKYWDNLPGVKAWISYSLMQARMKGGVTTLLGRFIKLPDLVSNQKFVRLHAERAAINYIIQGSSAEIMKMALIKLLKLGLDVRLTVHDEFIVQAKDDYAETTRKKVEQCMANVVALKIPLLVDAHVGQNWREAKEG